MFVEGFSFGSLSSTFVIGIASVILLYWWSIKNHGYWRKKGVPCAKTLPFLGSLKEAIDKPLHEMEYDRYFKLGKVYGHFEGRNPLLSVGDPVLLKDILVKDFFTFPNRRFVETGDKVMDNIVSLLEGEDWKRVRSIITPTFSTGKIKRMMYIIKDCSKILVQNFKNSIENGDVVDAKKLYGAFTMDVIASSAFSTKIDSHNNPDNEFARTARKIFTQTFGLRVLIFLMVPGLMKFLGLTAFDSNTTKFFQQVTLQIIKERKKSKQVSNDFLQFLMDAVKESELETDVAEKEGADIASNYGEEDAGHHIFKQVTSKHLSMDELVAQCVIFFLAGYDTTASTLTMATYNLAVNPDIQDRVRREVLDAIRETKGEVTYEAIQNLKCLDNVISETLRLYPPVVRPERLAVSDYKLGNTGITIPKGMLITIPVYAIHRDPQNFPEPEKFDPDRFSVEERAKRNPYTYLPFGAGPRNCVGMRFALLEIKVCLAHVIATFNIKRCAQTKVPMEFVFGQGLMQPKEVILELEMRTDCPLMNET